MKKIIVIAILFVSAFGAQKAFAAITNQLDFGSTGAQVTELQKYLSLNSTIYPSGLVTGYFGPLTQAAVQRFQAANGIVSAGTPETTGFGRVGPQTMLKINLLTGTDGGINVSDSAPVINNVHVQYSSTNATFSWSTNELSQGQLFYDLSPLKTDEATGPGQAPYVSGAYSYDAGNTLNHTITIQNLKPNSTYYYLLRSVDNMKNMSMTPTATFQTNQ